jgi:hypothetical protein
LAIVIYRQIPCIGTTGEVEDREDKEDKEQRERLYNYVLTPHS